MIKSENLARIIATQRKHGMSDEELCVLFNLPIQTIHSLIELEREISEPIEIEPEEVEEDIYINETTAEMYKKYQSGCTMAEIGREYKISRQAIYLRFKGAKLPTRQSNLYPLHEDRIKIK